MNKPIRYILERAKLRCVANSRLSWDIVTFLRGPDFELEDAAAPSSFLKEYTTARVRAIIGADLAGVGVINPCALTANEREERDRLIYLGPTHFHLHWNSAVHAIRVLYRYDLFTERPWTPWGARK